MRQLDKQCLVNGSGVNTNGSDHHGGEDTKSRAMVADNGTNTCLTGNIRQQDAPLLNGASYSTLDPADCLK